MEPWQAVILGLVEGITEYLPISSTGHLIIASSLLGLDHPPEIKVAVDAFSIVIQGGAILAVLGLYRKRVAEMVLGLVGRHRHGRRLLLNLLIAFLPAAVIGVTLDRLLDLEALLFRPGPVIAALGVGGLVMLALGPWQRGFFHEAAAEGRAPAADPRRFVDLEQLTWRRALLIGFMQCVAIWPGMSRAMMTIVGGMVAGLRPRQAAEFSFLLGLPTLGGACVYRGLTNLASGHGNMLEKLGLAPLGLGILVAALAAAAAIRWLIDYLGRHGVAVFGWYRLGLCAAVAGLWWAGIVRF